MSKHTQQKSSKSNMSPEDRAKRDQAIADILARKKAAAEAAKVAQAEAVDAPVDEPEVKAAPVVAKAPVGKKPQAPEGYITVADIARERGIDPKAARAKLRRAKNSKAPDGRWPAVKVNSDEYNELVAIFMSVDRPKAATPDAPQAQVESETPEA